MTSQGRSTHGPVDFRQWDLLAARGVRSRGGDARAVPRLPGTLAALRRAPSRLSRATVHRFTGNWLCLPLRRRRKSLARGAGGGGLDDTPREGSGASDARFRFHDPALVPPYLLWVHWRSLLARVRGLRRRSPLLPFLLVGFVLGYLLLGTSCSTMGSLRFRVPGGRGAAFPRILFLIFGFFFVMLIFSNLIIGYSTLFKNRETNWFLTLPIRHADVIAGNSRGPRVSSWALMFLSAP